MSIERISVALQCIVDGVVVRYQVDPELIDQSTWSRASLLADMVIAFCVGVLDFDNDRQATAPVRMRTSGRPV